MSYWAKKRKIFIILFFLLFLTLFSFIFYFLFIKKTPTCFDGIKNGDELRVDCGGSCERVCSFEVAEINVFWARAFEVAKNVYNVAALIENPNFDAKLEAHYKIKLLNDKGVILREFDRLIFLDPAEKRVLFIPSVISKDGIDKVFVDFYNIKNSLRAKKKDLKIKEISKFLEEDGDFTRLNIRLKNDDIYPKRDIEVTAILYGQDENVIDISRTFVDYFDKREEKETFMTWRGNLKDRVKKIDLYLRQSE